MVLPFFLAAVALSRRHRGVQHVASLGSELIKLGHEVRLMPPAYDKAYVKRRKSDTADVEAIPTGQR